MSTSINPVWKDGPPICNLYWLPGFETKNLADEFHEKNAPGTHTQPAKLCEACGLWHFKSTARGKAH